MAHIRQSRPDYDLGLRFFFQAKVLKPFMVCPPRSATAGVTQSTRMRGAILDGATGVPRS